MVGTKKSLGQHWLKDRALLDEIADLAIPDSAPDEAPDVDFCLEIGPGLGTLTSSLLRRFPGVVAVELDDRLAANLPKSFPGKNLTVLHQNCLDLDLSRDLPQFFSDSKSAKYVVAANIPYYITSPIIEKLLSLRPLPAKIVLLVQKEVAERFAAPASKTTFAALNVQNRARVSLGPVVRREFFTPPPKVDSQVLILEPLAAPQVSPEVIKFASRAFAAPRKKLTANLATAGFTKEQIAAAFKACQIDPNARPANLTLATWQALHQALTSH